MKRQPNPPDKQNLKSEKNQQKGSLGGYAKYSAIGFQMVFIIALTSWGGVKLDEKTGTETPWFTIFLSLLGVMAAIYTAIKDFIK